MRKNIIFLKFIIKNLNFKLSNSEEENNMNCNIKKLSMEESKLIFYDTISFYINNFINS
jgi:hypothetical protein